MAQRGLRPGSAKPLFVASIGVEPLVAVERVQRLHGEFRIPTLLKLVDQLSRGSSR